MEPTTIQMKAKSENLLFLILWFCLMAALLVFACIELGSGGSPVFPFSMLLAFMVNLHLLLPPLLNKSIRFEIDGIVLERRSLKPRRIPYTAYQYTQENLLVFTGFTLNLDEYQNKQELLAAFQLGAQAGLIPWREKEANKQMKVTKVILLIAALIAFAAAIFYFSILRHDMYAADLLVLGLAVAFLIIRIIGALINRFKRTSQAS